MSRQTDIGRWIWLALVTVWWSLGAAGQDAAPPPPEEAKPTLNTPNVLRAVDLGGLETRTAAMMLSAQEAGDLDVSMIAIPLPSEAAADSALSRVVLAVDISGDALLAAADSRLDGGKSDDGGKSSGSGDDENPLITEIYIYAIDAQNGLVASLTQAFRLDLKRYRTDLIGGSVQFFGSLELPPGQFSLRLLVSHRRSGRIGLRVQPVTVPSWRSARVLLPPLRREPAGRGVLVRQAGDVGLPFPIMIDDQPWVPSAPRSVQAGNKAAYLLIGRGLQGDLRAEILGSDGGVLPGADLQGPQTVARGLPGVETLAAELIAHRLDAGDYRLRVSSADGSLSALAPFSVRLPSSTALAVQAGAHPRKRPSRSKDIEAMRSAFHTAFGFLDSRDRTALLPLIEIEQDRIGDGLPKQQKRLGDQELRIAAELGSHDVEALVPMMWLHEELYRHYRQTKEFLLATHSRQVLIRLTELYLDNQSSPEAGQVVADVLVSIAGFLQNAGSLISAEHTYLAALEHRSDHSAALIGLATIRESYASYKGAAQALEQLVEGGSSDPEISLRLALNRIRIGSNTDSAERLQALAALPAPLWIAALAAQELANFQTASKQPEAAIDTLKAAVERHPNVQRLRLQLASQLDRLGRASEAREVLQELDPRAGRDQMSPRLRYSRMPRAPYLNARKALADAASERLPRVLESLTPDPAVAQADPNSPESPAAGASPAGETLTQPTPRGNQR